MNVLSFQALGAPFEIRDRGTVYAVKNPGGYDEPNDLKGQIVNIDGLLFKVRGVETFQICRPYPDSLDFGLLVEPC